VALKQLKKAEIIKLKQVDHIINENTIGANLKHPFIVNFEGFC
jgi:protein kinase A